MGVLSLALSFFLLPACRACPPHHTRDLTPFSPLGLAVLINQAWFAHCAGAEIRNKVLERIEFKISRSGPPIPDLMKASLAEHLIEEVHARAQWDVEEVREQVRRRRELKERE